VFVLLKTDLSWELIEMLKTETLKLKLEAGKKYVDRCGRVFGPLVAIGVGRYFGEHYLFPMWNNDGRAETYLVEDCPFDLVAEYREPEPAEECPIDQSLCILDACCGKCDRYTAEQIQIEPAEPTIASLHHDREKCCGPFESFEPVEVQVEIVNQGEPQRGQFWSYSANRKYCVFIIGKNIDGHWVSVDRHGEYEVFNGHRNMSFEYWHHEPGFMNFDGPIPAEQEQNAEDNPNKWVTQDRVAPRDNIDEYTWMKIGLKPTEENWRRGEGNFSNCYRHGTRHFDEVLHVRCRLRDLPPLPAVEAAPSISDWGPFSAFSPDSLTASPKQQQPTNQQLFEMIANLRDQLHGMNERLRIVEHVAAC
jgi:hypothetical protein